MEVIITFDFGGELEEVCSIFGNGHINETYCAVFSTEAEKRYILQKMNKQHFQNLLDLWRISVESPPG